MNDGRENFPVQGVYRHFKGNLYELLCVPQTAKRLKKK